MEKRLLLLFSLLTVFSLTGCNGTRPMPQSPSTESREAEEEARDTALISITPTEKRQELEEGFSAVRYEGDSGFDQFLSSGGASTDEEVIRFLAENLPGNLDLGFSGGIFGCSTITARNAGGEI